MANEVVEDDYDQNLDYEDGIEQPRSCDNQGVMSPDNMSRPGSPNAAIKSARTNDTSWRRVSPAKFSNHQL